MSATLIKILCAVMAMCYLITVFAYKYQQALGEHSKHVPWAIYGSTIIGTVIAAYTIILVSKLQNEIQ